MREIGIPYVKTWWKKRQLALAAEEAAAAAAEGEGAVGVLAAPKEVEPPPRVVKEKCACPTTLILGVLGAVGAVALMAG